MHDLFTRGIGADGKLRPPREEAPELYQETAIGWIPKEWELSTCFDICESIIDCKNRTPPITPSGYPVIRTPNVRNGLFIDEQLVFTDEKSYIIWTARGKPKVDDVVITREAPVGEVCKIPKHHPNACLGQRMMLYRTDSQKIENDFFLYMLQSRQIQNRLDLISGGSTVGHVRVGDIRSLYAFYPKNSSEQQKIAEMLNKSSEKFGSETNSLEKLRKQKAGLMHDLLTGKVQVNVGETEAVDG
jgi:type I restriction enzyme S subunit